MSLIERRNYFEVARKITTTPSCMCVLYRISDVLPPQKSRVRFLYRASDRTWEEFVNTLPKVVGFLRVLRFPPTGLQLTGWVRINSQEKYTTLHYTKYQLTRILYCKCCNLIGYVTRYLLYLLIDIEQRRVTRHCPVPSFSQKNNAYCHLQATVILTGFFEVTPQVDWFVSKCSTFPGETCNFQT